MMEVRSDIRREKVAEETRHKPFQDKVEWKSSAPIADLGAGLCQHALATQPQRVSNLAYCSIHLCIAENRSGINSGVKFE